MAERKLKIAQLSLDPTNPRHEPSESQRHALQQIIDDQDVKLAVLAEDIVEAGLSPLDRLLVLKAERADQYTVLEGNRRTAALKILSNPAVLASLDVRPALANRLKAAAQDFDKREVEPIAAFEVTTREDGNRWIEQRHTGENEGSGIVGWSGLQSRRFVGSDPALQALEFVKQHGGLSDTEQKKLSESRFITTLDRLLSTPDVRKAIGVTVKAGKLVTDLPADEVIKPLRRMVVDLAEKNVNVTQLKTKDQQKAYVASFDKASLPDLRKKVASREVGEIQADEFTSKSQPKTKRRKPSPSDRKAVVPKGSKLDVQHNRAADIYDELRKLRLEDTPNAIAVLLRVFLELSTDHYLTQNGIPLDFTVTTKGGAQQKDKPLVKKAGEAIAHMGENGAPKKDLQGISRALGNKNSPLSVDLLHSYVHGQYATPSPKDLRAAWDNAEPYFARIWP